MLISHPILKFMAKKLDNNKNFTYYCINIRLTSNLPDKIWIKN